MRTFTTFVLLWNIYVVLVFIIKYICSSYRAYNLNRLHWRKAFQGNPRALATQYSLSSLNKKRKTEYVLFNCDTFAIPG